MKAPTINIDYTAPLAYRWDLSVLGFVRQGCFPWTDDKGNRGTVWKPLPKAAVTEEAMEGA